MKIKLSSPISMEKLAQVFAIPLTLLKASNPHLQNELLNKNDLVYIPGYKLKKISKKNSVSLAAVYKKYNVTNEMMNILKQPNDMNNLYIPIKIKELVLNDFDNYTYDKMINQLDQLIEIYPFIQKNIIGYSRLNRPIIELTIGTGLYQTHFNASFHGNEWITSAVLMKCINKYVHLLMNSRHDQSLYEKFTETKISFVPMVNPDGVNLVINGLKSAGEFKENVLLMNNNESDFTDWKANIVGVDLNKQYPALWEKEKKRGAKQPTFRDYAGSHPLSEPEAIAMAKLTKRRNFKRVHALHTQGEEIYWGFQQLEPDISEKIIKQYELITNYKSVRYIDNYAGYKDWFINYFRRPGFTIELGKGKNPLPFSQFPQLVDITFNLFLMNLALTI